MPLNVLSQKVPRDKVVYVENVGQQSSPDPHPVAGLAKVHGSRIVIDFRGDFAKVLVARERRTGRWGGIATDSMTIHQGWTYDLEFDTTDEPNPLDIARQVLDRLQRLGPATR